MNQPDPGALRLQVPPNLDVATDGRVTAAWWDFRDDAGAFTTKEYTVFGWDDTRNGTAEAPTQDISARAVQFKALGGGGSDLARNLAAAMAGLAIAGLLLLVAALAARRPPPAAAHARGAGEATRRRQLVRSSSAGLPLR